MAQTVISTASEQLFVESSLDEPLLNTCSCRYLPDGILTVLSTVALIFYVTYILAFQEQILVSECLISSSVLCFEKFILQLGLVEICSPALNQHFVRKLKELRSNMVFIYFSPKKNPLDFFKKQKLKGTLEF